MENFGSLDSTSVIRVIGELAAANTTRCTVETQCSSMPDWFMPGLQERRSIIGRGFESSRRISGQERGGGIRVGEATNRAQIRQKLVKSMLDFPITTDARLTVIPAFARRSPFWISDIHCRHTLSDVEGRRDSFQLELERLFDREEPSNANSVDFSIVEYTSGERLSSFNSDFFPFLFLFPFSLSYSSFTQRGKCYVIFCQFCFRNDSTISINCVVTGMFNGCLDWRGRKSRKWNSIGENTGRNNSELSSSFLRNIRCG